MGVNYKNIATPRTAAVASEINHKVGPLKCTSLCSAAAVKTNLRGFKNETKQRTFLIDLMVAFLDFRFAAILIEATFIFNPTLLISWKWLHGQTDETPSG